MRIVFSRHARQRLFERDVPVEAVTRIVEKGRTILLATMTTSPTQAA
jgi:hypothetical protein